jgi:DNA repair protein SbcC/Rad50
MLPQRLRLTDFLSYRQATLDFQGLHTACICGPNGSGKSSLLEALAWAVWGESRVATEDDIILQGASEAQVDFTFTSHGHTYRILRRRYRGHSTTLEFQLAAPAPAQTPLDQLEFYPLTAKNLRATQQLILQHLKLDYDTFVNSAYLRQGRADEFMIKRPGDRKQMLAELLKLGRYDQLAGLAKEQAYQLKAALDQGEQRHSQLSQQYQQQQSVAYEQELLGERLVQTQQQHQEQRQWLEGLQQQQQQYQAQMQQLAFFQQQQLQLELDCQRLQQDLNQLAQQRQDLETLVQRADEIALGYRQWCDLRQAEAEAEGQFAQEQQLQAQLTSAQTQLQQQIQPLQKQQQKLQQHSLALQAELQQLQPILGRQAEMEQGLQQLVAARKNLHQLNRLQAQAAPLLAQQQSLLEQQRQQRQIRALRLAELHATQQQLQGWQTQQPQIQQRYHNLCDRIQELEQWRTYQDQIRDKGLERRTFVEQLKIQQRALEEQVVLLERKIQKIKPVIQPHPEPAVAMLKAPAPLSFQVAERQAPYRILPPRPESEEPVCPLCDRPLDEHHSQVILTKHQQEKAELLDQLWVVREQLTVSEHEIQLLRREYQQVEERLQLYGPALERRGQLQQKLQSAQSSQQDLVEIQAQIHLLEAEPQDLALQEALASVQQDLIALAYDERDHALARGQVDRWRWVEARQGELKQAQRRQRRIQAQLPALEPQIQALETEIAALEQRSPLGELAQQIEALNYQPEAHQQLRQALRQQQSWELQQQQLASASCELPKLNRRLEELLSALQQRRLAADLNRQRALDVQIPGDGDSGKEIEAIAQTVLQLRQELDHLLAQQGKLQQQNFQLEQLQRDIDEVTAAQQLLLKQHRVYQELAQAFGKNGIQALMIENLLPQLESQTNQILSRLSANQLHVQFVTQRQQKKGAVETLDILIADAQGTRPYETYSGGEAFRVSFAVRLALARLLAQRSGNPLQLLIIDEGFGTQDQEGCDRLIAAITAIAPEFACILTVTHVPHLKQAFQTRIEVRKTPQGSQLTLIS